MREGRLLAIHVAPTSGAPMQELPAVNAIAGRGLQGDRYAAGKAKWIQGEVKPDQHVTLIETEALEQLNVSRDQAVTHRQTRRNLLTQGVELLGLIGKRFRVGDVEMQGIEPCTPCGYLEQLTQVDGIKDALKPSGGGLRAEILCDGVITTGDIISLCGDAVESAE